MSARTFRSAFSRLLTAVQRHTLCAHSHRALTHTHCCRHRRSVSSCVDLKQSHVSRDLFKCEYACVSVRTCHLCVCIAHTHAHKISLSSCDIFLPLLVMSVQSSGHLIEHQIIYLILSFLVEY